MEQLSRNYTELVSLFEEFREFIKPEVVDGVPLFCNEEPSNEHQIDAGLFVGKPGGDTVAEVQ